MNLARRLFRFPVSVSATDPTHVPLSNYILGFSSHSPQARSYAETHLARLVWTVDLTPKGGPADAILEMAAYMQITPAFRTVLGYGEVHGCYLGELGAGRQQDRGVRDGRGVYLRDRPVQCRS